MSVLVGSKVPTSIAKTVPARPHRAPVSVHVMPMTRSALTPQHLASIRFAAVARIALPSFVYRSMAATDAITIRLIAMMMSCTVVKTRPPALKVRPWLSRYDTPTPPAIAAIPNSMISAMPRETITSVIGADPRRWKGA